MVVKELLQLGRDPVLAIFLVFGFTGVIYLAGSGVRLDLNEAPLRVHDADRSAASRELIHRFRLPYFRYDGEVSRPAEGVRLLDQGRAMLVLDIPPRFEESLLEGRPISVQMQIDATNTALGFLAAGYGTRIVSELGREVTRRRIGAAPGAELSLPVIRDAHRVWFNPNQNDRWFHPIAELLEMITLFALLLPASAMVREKERGTIEQLLVSPLSPLEIMMPKVVAMTAVILIATALALFGVLRLVFDVPIRGSVWLFFVASALYAFTTAGIGLVIATLARNQAQVGMLAILIFMPMVFLSGATAPPEAMPGWLRQLTVISPLRHFIDAAFGVLLRGAPLEVLWDTLLAMTLVGSVNFALGLWRFRRQFR